MNPLAPATWWLTLVGWSVLVALWHTSAIALGVATWRLWRREVKARTQYSVESAALMLAVTLTVATPAALIVSARTTPLSIVMSTGAAATGPSPSPGSSFSRPPSARWDARGRSIARRTAPWIGLMWCVGFAAALIRLGGGWGLARWIRRQATDVRSPAVARAAAEVAATWALPPVTLLSSAHVDAPVVVGARSPAVLLPLDLEARLDADALPPLLAHELAHVERRDYAANLAQSLADALLFFSPGAWWLSRDIREAREYCCDDIVAARCGTRAYVSALTTLARLGVVARARPVVNAAGPRLIVRIRRLLQEDTMLQRPHLAAIAVSVGLVSVVIAGRGVPSISAASLAQSTPATFTSPIAEPVPRGFVATQPGLAVALRDMTSSAAAHCGLATIENRANVTLTGVRFSAIAMVGGPAGSTLSGVLSASSTVIDVDVPPGGIATAAADLLSLDDLRQTIRTGSPQVMCAIVEARYANGAAWSAPPATAFAPTQAEVARALIGGAGRPGSPICRDQNGSEYSDGAIVPIALEPGPTLARCRDGAWGEYVLPETLPDAAR